MKSDEEWAVDESQRISRLEADNARLSKLLGLTESYRLAASTPAKWMTTPSKKLGRATACMQLSDLHLDEVVDPGQMNGLNAYNREIAEQRLQRWASKCVEMGYRHKHAWDGGLLFLGGDMVSGAIHEELMETNEDYLPSSMVHWAPRLAAAIGQVVDFYGKLHVEAIVGNHGRLTKYKQTKGRGRNSWDWLLAQMIRFHFASDDRVTWNIAEGSFLFPKIYDRCVYLTHGDEVGGGSGWAGIWSPLGTIHRRGMELASSFELRPSYCVVGHWHQTILAHQKGISLNGSMKGYDEFASSLRLAPESARQNWWVETEKHGVTLAAALFLEDKKKEGW